MLLAEGNVIWFIGIKPDSSLSFQGTEVWILRAGVSILRQKLNIYLTTWHTYRFQWRQDYVGIFIGDMNYHVIETNDPNKIVEFTEMFYYCLQRHL